MRILLVSQMYPGPRDPDLGTFVRQLELALRDRGHEVGLAVLAGRVGGKRRWLELARRTAAAARRFRPQVVYAHFLVPTGLIGALASGAPLVVTAHGQDVANVGAIPGVGWATRAVVRRATTVIAVSDYLRRRLEDTVPEAVGKVQVIDSGVDLDRFSVRPPPPGPTSYLCVGSLTERKNVVRLARAFGQIDDATLTFLGDGPLRPRLERKPRVTLAGAVPHETIPEWIGRAHVVCQPSLVEPFGQAVLEAMACGRSVVATRVGGPPEFVPDGAGVLVDPYDEDEIAAGLRRAAALPRPNPAALAAAALHDVRLQAEKVEAVLERAITGP
ncbi:MAG: glycosyltransferase [Actinomycetota bacterium]|nr:glycosyltransferase [Actinomycetota bacterium]